MKNIQILFIKYIIELCNVIKNNWKSQVVLNIMLVLKVEW